MKSLTVLSILAFCVFILSENVNADHLKLGHGGGHRLEWRNIKREGVTSTEVYREKLTFRAKSKYGKITYIEAIDNGWPDDMGNLPKVVEGGIDKNYIVIELKSQMGRGLDYTVTAFGY